MTDQKDNVTLFSAIRSSAIGLAIFAFFTAGIISVTQVLTEETILENERAFEAKLLLSLLPSGYEAEQLLNSAQTFQSRALSPTSQLNVSDEESFYLAKNTEGDIAAVLLPVVAPDGYTEAIRLIVGIDPSGNLLGVRVTKHKETPGLGDQVETAKSDWIYNFNGTSLLNPQTDNWAVKKDGGSFDQLTGATITPRAIVRAVKQSLEFFTSNREALLTTETSQ